MNRHSMTSEERKEVQEIENSLQVSSYLAKVLEAIHTGAAPRVDVPNYRAGAIDPRGGNNETTGFSMDFSGLSETLPEDQRSAEPENQGKTASQPPQMPSGPRITISKNQAQAIKKYPALIEFLGQDIGTKIAKEISSRIHIIIAEKINENSREANDKAILCEADRHNLKQYFVCFPPVGSVLMLFGYR